MTTPGSVRGSGRRSARGSVTASSGGPLAGRTVEFGVDPPLGNHPARPPFDHVGGDRIPWHHPRRVARRADDSDAVVAEGDGFDRHGVVSGRIEEQQSVESERRGSGRGHRRWGQVGGGHLRLGLVFLDHVGSHRWPIRLVRPLSAAADVPPPACLPGDPGRGRGIGPPVLSIGSIAGDRPETRRDPPETGWRPARTLGTDRRTQVVDPARLVVRRMASRSGR